MNNEAFSRVLIDKELEFSNWNLLDSRQVRFECNGATGRADYVLLLPKAGEILAFDTFIANPDRTVANPNCLSNGREFAIFDHELAFLTEGLIGWKPPWDKDAINFP